MGSFWIALLLHSVSDVTLLSDTGSSVVDEKTFSSAI
jgi:hypothetical protein